MSGAVRKFKLISLAGSATVSLVLLLLGLRLIPAPDEHRVIGIILLALSPAPLVLSLFSLRLISILKSEAMQISTRDPLTGLYNQTTFWDLLQYETERSKRQKYRFSLLEIDIDNFKAINDAYGHEVGDAFLQKFSEILKNAVRRGDIAARYGGDLFAAILPVCDEAQAYLVANRLMEDLRAYPHLLPDGAHVRETVSIGIAVFPDHAASAKDLHLVADGMMSQAKFQGKDRLSLPSTTTDLATFRSAGEKSILIMEALRQKRIVPYFQPIRSVREDTILAYEVLTRIVTPERVLTASEFIEAAEGMGVIGKLDYLLIEQAFDKVKQEQYRGMLFLNLSPKALVMSEFMPTIRGLLKQYGLSPSQMVFELTERDTVKNLGTVDKFVRELREEGFRFALDDFGSGYSSFLYMRAFKVDYVKVDGEFVRHMASENGMEKAIVANIASLAGSLGIKTIAEYVETEQILNEVASAGIDYAQGYYIRHPSPELT